jgi:MoaA/NifB/PqqE/SkfB family radical SAM enzyme
VPCCFWYTDDALGDLHRQPFEEIWEGRPYRRLRAELLSGELGPNCAHCPVLGIGDPADPRAYEAGATAGP